MQLSRNFTTWCSLLDSLNSGCRISHMSTSSAVQPSVSRNRTVGVGRFQHIPYELLAEILQMHIRKDVYWFTQESSVQFCLEAEMMTHYLIKCTGFAGFKDMLLGPELFALFRIARIFGGAIFMAFDQNTGMYPKSKPVIDYLNDRVFLSLSMDLNEKNRYLCNIIRLFCKHNEFELLDYLIEVVDNHLLSNTIETLIRANPTLFDKLPEMNLINVVNAHQACHCFPSSLSLAYIFLMLPDVNGLKQALSLFPLQQNFCPVELLSKMNIIVSSSDYDRHFSRNKILLFRYTMTLLTYIRSKVAKETLPDSLFNLTRLLYSIRLGLILKGGMTVGDEAKRRNIACKGTSLGSIRAATVNMLCYDICKMYTDETQRVILWNTVICARNRNLFKRLVLNPLGPWYCFRHRMLEHPHIEKVMSIDERMALGYQIKSLKFGLEVIRLCRKYGEDYPDDEWVEMFECKKRFALLAEIGDERRIRAVLQLFHDVRFADIIAKIVGKVENPLPFIKVVLEVRGAGIIGKCTLGDLNFLRALLMNQGGDDVIKLIGRHEILPRSDFFEALLDDRDLANAFQTVRGRCLRGNICIVRESFSRRCFDEIMKLLEILEISVKVDKDAFRLGDESTFLQHFHHRECTLEELAVRAQKPGFLAVLALAFSRDCIYQHLENGRKLTFEQFNPLHVSSLSLFRRWFVWDKEGLFRDADWCVVIMFFIAKPNDELLYAARSDGVYPATLAYIARKYCGYYGIMGKLDFRLKSHEAKFEREVLPVINCWKVN